VALGEFVIEIVVLLFAAFPCALFFANLRHFRRAPIADDQRRRVSVLIPARNEERSIEASVRSVLANEGVELECVVLDDGSTDATPVIVHRLAANDPRVRLVAAPPLPDGWCGKQHACHVLSTHARFERWFFVDADVRLTRDALARMTRLLDESGCGLVSGFPRQETKTALEILLLPLIHFVLLGFLPVRRMRESSNPAYSAGCGQMMLARADAYRDCGGHSAIASSLHDGLRLPHAFRSRGYRTDIFDACDIAVCRMYQNAAEVWNGLTKNATEGLGAPSRIVPVTAVLVIGQILPYVLLLVNPLAAILAWAPRLVASMRFRQSLTSAVLHPAGVVVLLAIQWVALTRKWAGKPAAWKDRTYVSG
jgi:hypothetical protein